MAAITEDYVSFETAKLLKEKGFDIPCDNCYDSSGKTPNESVYGGAYIETLDYNADPFVKSSFPKFKTFSAPTLQLAMKWLREVHNIVINIGWGEVFEDKFQWWCIILNYKDGNILRESEYYATYEEACEAALKYSLENLI